MWEECLVLLPCGINLGLESGVSHFGLSLSLTRVMTGGVVGFDGTVGVVPVWVHAECGLFWSLGGSSALVFGSGW